MSVFRINRLIVTGALLAVACFASGCSSIDRLSQIGEKPKLTEIENPTTQPGYKPVQMPMPKPEQASYNANSLWRNGSRAFFRDPRADRRRHRGPGGHPERQHHRFLEDRAGPHRLWRPRPDHRRAATPLRPAGDGRIAAVLNLSGMIPKSGHRFSDQDHAHLKSSH